MLTRLLLPVLLLLPACGADPTVTTSAPPETPAACLEALDLAEETFGLMAEVMDTVSVYPPLVERAAQAGATGNVTETDAIADVMATANVRLEQLHGELPVNEWQAASEECRR